MKQISIVILLLAVVITTASTNFGVANNEILPTSAPSVATADEVSTSVPSKTNPVTESPVVETTIETSDETNPNEITEDTENSDTIGLNVIEPEEEYYSNNSISIEDYSDNDLDLLSRAIYVEVGCNWIPDWVQLYVGSVVLNRVNSSLFPDDIESVLYDPGQYYPPALYWYTPDERTIENAHWLLENGSVLPPDVLGENGEQTGDGIYAEYYDEILDSTLYFTYVYG